MTASDLAPAIAVVGPANSGKTTLLHLLDRVLQTHPHRPLAYVVKGNPDGTGRYLYESPDLREPLKPRVKGAWGPETVETLCRWIDHCRSHLELVLVDFGGRHSPANDRLLSRCSHFIAVVREADNAPPEDGDLASWEELCRRSGLACLGRVRTLWESGTPRSSKSETGIFEATFRSDAKEPGDATNVPVASELAEEILRLRHRRPKPPYLDLGARDRWRVEDLQDLGGLAPSIDQIVRAGGPLMLGGPDPIWVYASALHRALDLDPDCLVLQFDPKLSWSFMEIPRSLSAGTDPELSQQLAVSWRTRPSGRGATLDAAPTTGDKLLVLFSAPDLTRCPVPEGTPPEGPLVISAYPTWLALTYSRWVRTSYPGRPLGHWDATLKKAVFVHGPGAPGAEAWEV